MLIRVRRLLLARVTPRIAKDHEDLLGMLTAQISVLPPTLKNSHRQLKT